MIELYSPPRKNFYFRYTKMSIAMRSYFILFFWIVSLCIQLPESIATTTEEEIHTDNPPLFRIGRLILLGTYHIVPFDVFDHSTQQAIKQADIFGIESCFSPGDLSEEELCLKHCVVDHEASLKEVFSPDYARYCEHQDSTPKSREILAERHYSFGYWFAPDDDIDFDVQEVQGMDKCIKQIGRERSALFMLETREMRWKAFGWASKKLKGVVQQKDICSMPENGESVPYDVMSLEDVKKDYVSNPLRLDTPFEEDNIFHLADYPRHIQFLQEIKKQLARSSGTILCALGSDHLHGETGLLNLCYHLLTKDGESHVVERFDPSIQAFTKVETLQELGVGLPIPTEKLREIAKEAFGLSEVF